MFVVSDLTLILYANISTEPLTNIQTFQLSCCCNISETFHPKPLQPFSVAEKSPWYIYRIRLLLVFAPPRRGALLVMPSIISLHRMSPYSTVCISMYFINNCQINIYIYIYLNILYIYLFTVYYI